MTRRPPYAVYLGVNKSPMLRALRASMSTGSRRNVLIALLLLGNGAELVQERQTDIALVAGVSIDVCRYALRDLRVMGEIDRIRYKQERKQQVNIYRILLPMQPEPTPREVDGAQ